MPLFAFPVDWTTYGLAWRTDTFKSVAGESKDQVAVDYIMGHVRDDMANLYRERIRDERLLAVGEHVHCGLWGQKKTKNYK